MKILPNFQARNKRKTSLSLAMVAIALFPFTSSSLAAQATYSIGDPSDVEQHYVELINRARSNPAAEAQRLKNTTDASVLGAYSFFGVNLNLMVTQFSALTVAPPVSINAKLLTAARVHSADMLANNYQGHVGTDGSQPWDRGTAQGYAWTTYGENVYASATSTFFGHAGLEVDWGTGTGGMQSPAGHRLNIHNATYREIGVGVSLGTNGSVGPQVLTQDFAAQPSPVPFITGVVYYDFNANGVYDEGEGIGGVNVTVTGANFTAVTSTSGGYSVPVPGNGSYTVAFTAPGMVTGQSTVSITDGNNVKIDYVPGYTAPVITGSSALSTGQSGTYNFNTVGAATGYEWKQSSLAPFTLVDGAEQALAHATASISAGYFAVENDTVKNGIAAFHLAHPVATLQVLQFNHTLRIASNSALVFWSRLGWAGSGQVAAVQVSNDGGNQWLDVWAMAGTNSAGQTSFSQQVVPLSFFAGQDVVIRFVYRFNSGTYYPQTSAGVGFYFDDVSVTNAQELLSTTTASAGNGSFQFSTQSGGTYSLAVRALLPGRKLPWGPAKTVTVQAPAATVTLAVQANPSNGGSVSGGGSFLVGSSQQISATPNGGWKFSSWNDGNTQNPRTVTVPANGATYTATFTQVPVQAQITTPANGSALTSGTVTFGWSTGVGVTAYYLTVGSKVNGQDVFAKAVTGTSQAVAVPMDGRTIYVTFYSMINGQWQPLNTSYTTFAAQSQLLTVNGVGMTSGNIPTASTTFGWSTGTNVSKNYLVIGSTPTGQDIFVNYVTGTTQTVNLPTDGRTLYVTLYSMINGAWVPKSYTFTALNIPAASATMANVTTGSTVLTGTGTLTGGTAVFTWTPGSQVTGYYLTIGSTPGKYDIYNAAQGTSLTRTVNVPVDGRTLYVTLYSMIKGVWQTNNYTYTAFSAQAMITTLNGGPMTVKLPAGSLAFAWSSATGLGSYPGGSYLLAIGTAPGKYEYFRKQLSETSTTATNLPQDGRTLYITLYSFVNGQWISQVYTCQAAG